MGRKEGEDLRRLHILYDRERGGRDANWLWGGGDVRSLSRMVAWSQASLLGKPKAAFVI